MTVKHDGQYLRLVVNRVDFGLALWYWLVGMGCDDEYWCCVCPPWASYEKSSQRLNLEKPRREEGS